MPSRWQSSVVQTPQLAVDERVEDGHAGAAR